MKQWLKKHLDLWRAAHARARLQFRKAGSNEKDRINTLQNYALLQGTERVKRRVEHTGRAEVQDMFSDEVYIVALAPIVSWCPYGVSTVIGENTALRVTWGEFKCCEGELVELNDVIGITRATKCCRGGLRWVSGVNFANTSGVWTPTTLYRCQAFREDPKCDSLMCTDENVESAKKGIIKKRSKSDLWMNEKKKFNIYAGIVQTQEKPWQTGRWHAPFGRRRQKIWGAINPFPRRQILKALADKLCV